jgi:hypothetical protein
VHIKFTSFSLKGCSPFWKDVMYIHTFLSIDSFKIIGNREAINFWHDTWHGNGPLTLQFPIIYAKVKNDRVTLAQVWNAGNIKLQPP